VEEHKCLNSELWHACAGPLCFLARFDPLLLFFLLFGAVAPFFSFCFLVLLAAFACCY